MSTERAVEFIAETAQNSSLQERLQQVKTPEDILQIAREQGYEFTAEEMNLATQAVEEVASGELSDEELESVAGGFGIPSFSSIVKFGKKAYDTIKTHGPTVLTTVQTLRKLF